MRDGISDTQVQASSSQSMAAIYTISFLIVSNGQYSADVAARWPRTGATLNKSAPRVSSMTVRFLCKLRTLLFSGRVSFVPLESRCPENICRKGGISKIRDNNQLDKR